jgi:hypothetical protein
MRRLVTLTVLAIALAVPAVAYAVAGGSDDGTLSVKAGAGRVYLNITGTVVGRMGGNGFIRVIDPNPNDGSFDFLGCDATKNLSDSTKDIGDSTAICKSNNGKGVVRFRAIGGNYRITIQGSGIFLSAVGHGYVTLNGAGNDPSWPGIFDGTYSINDGPYKSLPDDLHPFPLGAPAGG